MAVQKKTSSTSEKKEKKEINWMQVCVIGFCVLLVVMCVVSFANFSNFFRNPGTNSGSTIPAEIGYPVVVDYTMKKDDTSMMMGRMPMFAGATVDTTQYLSDSDGNVFAIHADEYNAISQGVLGHVPGDSFTVNGPGVIDHVSYMPKDDVEKQGLNYDDIKIGTVLNASEPYTDADGNEKFANVNAVVIEKTDKMLTVQFGADTIDVTFVGYYQNA